MVDTGLPGKPKNVAPPTVPTANGLPGFSAMRQKSSVPTSSTTALTKSASPTETPPLAMTKSACPAASWSARRMASRLSGRRPMSNGVTGKSAMSLSRAKRFES